MYEAELLCSILALMKCLLSNQITWSKQTVVSYAAQTGLLLLNSTVFSLFVQYLFILAGHDVGHTQVGQDHSAHIQDLQRNTQIEGLVRFIFG